MIAIPAGATADDETAMREIVPEGLDALEMVRLVGGRLACVYLHDAHHRIAVHELDGTFAADVALPGIGTVTGLAGRREDEDLHLSFATFLAARVLAVHMADASVREVRRPALAWNPGRLRHRAGVRPVGRRDAGSRCS